MRDGTNQRDDDYDGSIEKRIHFLNEVLDAVLQAWPANRVGIRLTPEGISNSMTDSGPFINFSCIINQLNQRGLAYLHVLEGDMLSQQRKLDYLALRK